MAPEPQAVPPAPVAPVEVHVHAPQSVYPEIQPVQDQRYFAPEAPAAPQRSVGPNFQHMQIYDPRARQS